MDIELKKAPSYCIQGTLMGPAGPAPLPFGIEAVQPSSGMSSNGGMVRGRPGGQTGPDGKIRLCDLAPGTYRLTAGVSNMTSISQQAPNVGLAEVTISDRDVTNFKLGTAPLMSLDGEVVWDGDPPQDPVTARVNVSLQQLGRYLLPGERGSARSDIPGTFSLPAVMVGEYGVRAFVSAPGLYVKEVTFGGHSVMHEPVRFGSTMAGATLHVVVGRDGGTVAARVADKDGNPVASTPVLVMPKEVASEAVLQNVLVIGETDQNGQFTSHTLAPGKYFVAAVTNQVDATTDTIDRLWRSRLRFQEVELTAGGSVQVTLPPITVE